MLTIEEYEQLRGKAMEELSYLRGIGIRLCEVAAVMSRDVLDAVKTYDGRLYTTMDVQDIRVRMKFVGCDVGIINEREENCIFRFAIKNARYTVEMKIGTLSIVTSDDGTNTVQELSYVSGDISFTYDTGMTVSFWEEPHLMRNSATNAAATAAQYVLRMDDSRWGLRWDRWGSRGPDLLPYTLDRLGQSRYTPGWEDPFVCGPQWIPSSCELGQVCVEPKIPAEVEVEPDTKVLDEFLSSFKILESAT